MSHWWWLPWVTFAACSGSGTGPPRNPTTAPFCRRGVAVDRIDKVLACTDLDRRYVETSVRRGSGWTWVREQDNEPFTAEETAHIDAALAAGVETICAGAGETELRYPSLHQPELGWPLWACQGDHLLVLHRGDAALELRDPLAAEMQVVFRVVGVHELGRVTTWNDR